MIPDEVDDVSTKLFVQGRSLLPASEDVLSGAACEKLQICAMLNKDRAREEETLPYGRCGTHRNM